MYIQPNEEDKRRAKGVYVYDPRRRNKEIPEELLCNTLINLKEFIEWASLPENNVDGYVFLDIRKRNGIIRQELNEWRYKNGLKPSQKEKSASFLDVANREAERRGFTLPE